MNELIFRYGETGLGFGILSQPDEIDGAPILVLLNAGLLHRSEPYRLNTLLSRRLAELGYIVLRVDLAGKGDSPSHKDLSNRDSVALDWRFIKQGLEQIYGQRPYLIGGLCSGADNAIKLSAADKDIKGLILLDSMSLKDDQFNTRQLVKKLTNPHKLIRIPLKVVQKLTGLFVTKTADDELYVDYRDAPTDAEIVQSCQNIYDQNGQIIAVFTSHALTHYNVEGQFSNTLPIEGFERCCDEYFWPTIDHTFSVQSTRDRLIEQISTWAKVNFSKLKG